MDICAYLYQDGPIGQVLAGPVSECNKNIFYDILM